MDAQQRGQSTYCFFPPVAAGAIMCSLNERLRGMGLVVLSGTSNRGRRQEVVSKDQIGGADCVRTGHGLADLRPIHDPTSLA